MTQAPRGTLSVRFRDLDVEVEYERDGDELDWWFTDPVHNGTASGEEYARIAAAVDEHSFT